MPERARWTTLAGIGLYNLVQNRLLPPAAYVPANVATSAALVGLARRAGCEWGELGMARARAPSGLLWGSAGASAALAVVAAGWAVPPLRVYYRDERAAGHGRAERLWRAAVRFPIGTALFEELAFRGVLTAVWRRSGSTQGQADLVAALAFGVWHVVPTLDALAGNPLGGRFRDRRSRSAALTVSVLGTAFSSLGFAWLRNRSGSLLAPWLTHASFNTASYLAGAAAWRRPRRPPAG